MAGQHEMEELYSLIEVKVDTSDLDNIIEFDWGSAEASDLMKPLTDIAEHYKKAYEKAGDDGALEIADRLRSLQELAIGLHGNIASGNLLNSITVAKKGEGYFVGTDIAHFYPLCIEFGRGDVYPINYEYLHYFTLSGVEVFSKHSRPSEPYPFVEPAFKTTMGEVEEILMRCIDNANY